MSDVRCPNCGYEGKPKLRILHWFVIVGLLLAGYNLYLQIIQVETTTQAGDRDMLSYGIMFSLAVIIGLIIYGMKGYCPKCGNKQIVKK